MENRRQEYRWRHASIFVGCAIIAAFATSILLTSVYAHTERRSGSAFEPGTVASQEVASKQLETSPHSGSAISRVSLRLAFQKDGKEVIFTVTQPEGKPIRIEYGGRSALIVPRIADSVSDNRIAVDVFRDAGLNLRIHHKFENLTPDISSFEIKKDDSELSVCDVRVKMTVVSITTQFSSSIAVPPARTVGYWLQDGGFATRYGSPECCVTCSGFTVCSECKVTGPCASCCVGSCC